MPPSEESMQGDCESSHIGGLAPIINSSKNSPITRKRENDCDSFVSPSPKRKSKQAFIQSASEIQRLQGLAALLNNLDNLARVGTIEVPNLPPMPMPGIEAPDGWQWAEPPGDKSIQLEEPLKTLEYMYNKYLIRATYKVLRPGMIRFRIYIVPKDVEGRRFLPLSGSVSKKRIKNFLSTVNANPLSWDGICEATFIPFLRPPPEHVSSLSEMYNRISPAARDPGNIPDLDIVDLVEEIRSGKITGMRSELYPYQRETVVEMLTKELIPDEIIDPRLTRYTLGNQEFYMDSDTFEVQIRPTFFESICGGILSEEMGFGKTCICIALICITKHQESRIPDRYLNVPIKYKYIPALSTLAAYTVTSHGQPWQKYANRLPTRVLNVLQSCRAFYDIENTLYSPAGRDGTRGKAKAATKRIYLSRSTLVLCPDALLSQWELEIAKHVEPEFLSVLIYTTFKPSVDMSQFDVVLMSQRRFGLEFKNASSPIHKIRWKRLLVDEGHSMATSSTYTAQGAKYLNTDRKWAVTGTPVPGLLGINVGLNSDSTSISFGAENRIDNGATRTSSDLARLGHIVTDFLQMPPWTESYGSWTKYCTAPYLDEKRAEVVERVLTQVLVRHRWTDLEKDVQLPPLYHNVVSLEPSLFNKFNINLFHAFVAVNAVSSDRRDQDYLFHRNNRAQLRRLVTNLQHSTFYWTGFSADDVQFMIDVANHCLTNGKVYTEDDIELLRNSIRSGQTVLNNSAWTFSSEYHEMGYFIKGMPQTVVESLPEGMKRAHSLSMAGPTVLSIQDRSRKIKRRDELGHILDHEISNIVHELTAFTNDAKGEEESTTGQPQAQPPVSTLASNIAKMSPRKSTSARTRDTENKMRDLPGVSQHTSKVRAEHKIQSHSSTVTQSKSFMNYSYDLSTMPINLGPQSVYRSAKIIGTFSSKLTYILSRVLELHREEKIIIFYEYDDIAYYIGEGLEILGIDHCFYTTSLPKQTRSKNLMAFNSLPQYRVMLMDLNLASHGLNVTGASRIFFINPVWQPNIEAQAMRRAHRIGQSKPVYVETLVLKDTIEDKMFDRRRKMTQSEFAAAKTVTDDGPTNELIAQSHFIDMNILDERLEYAQVFDPLVDLFKTDPDLVSD
ncbi:P-loop containing nucleoside triphosphate hydrolase protein [Lipomyces oligophaga]|uniref:P-loop containing nucleoside triphosphate hydrolase protein n=1 Tax=Lipomyces oligophaga TaxID=45792 RepID=UPI0034CFC158